MSVRIATELTLNGEGFTRVLQQKKAEMSAFSAFAQRLGVGVFSGKSARESADSFNSILAAQEKLEAFRKDAAFQRLADAEKIAFVESDIAAKKAQLAAMEGQTVERLAVQLSLERQLLQLDNLRAAAAARGTAIEAERAALVARNVRFVSGSATADTLSSPSGVGVLKTAGFGLGSLIKGGLGLLGIAGFSMIFERISAGVASHLAEVAELPKRIAGENERAKRAAEKLADLFRTDKQRLQGLKGQEGVARGMIANGLTEEDRAKAKADLNENQLAQREVQKRIYDAAVARIEKIREAQKAVADERNAREYEQLSLEDKLFRQQLRELSAKVAASRTKEPLERAAAELEAEKAITEQVKLRADIRKDEEEAWNRALQEEDKRRAEHNDLRKQFDEAQKNFAASRSELARLKRDALAYTLQELEKNKGGGRNTTAAGIAASRISSDESLARDLFRSGNRLTMFDPKTQKNFEAGAEFFQQRALAARGGLGLLRSDEREPFAAAQRGLEEAATQLKDAAAQLREVEVEVSMDK